MNGFKRLVGVFLAAPLFALAAGGDTHWNERGANWSAWEGSQLRTSVGEWIWSPAAAGEPLVALVFGTARPHAIFIGSFERGPEEILPQLRRAAADWLPRAESRMTAWRRAGQSAVPEPGTWIMIGLGVAFALWNARRRRRREA